VEFLDEIIEGLFMVQIPDCGLPFIIFGAATDSHRLIPGCHCKQYRYRSSGRV
jgi:hypothetical protein